MPLYLDGDGVRVVPESLELDDHEDEDMEEDKENDEASQHQQHSGMWF